MQALSRSAIASGKRSTVSSSRSFHVTNLRAKHINNSRFQRSAFVAELTALAVLSLSLSRAANTESRNAATHPSSSSYTTRHGR